MTSLDVRLKRIGETRNYQLDEIEHNDLMREKHKKPCKNLNYFEHSLLFISDVTGCLSISAFASIVGTPVGIKSYVVGL